MESPSDENDLFIRFFLHMYARWSRMSSGGFPIVTRRRDTFKSTYLRWREEIRNLGMGIAALNIVRGKHV